MLTTMTRMSPSSGAKPFLAFKTFKSVVIFPGVDLPKTRSSPASLQQNAIRRKNQGLAKAQRSKFKPPTGQNAVVALFENCV